MDPLSQGTSPFVLDQIVLAVLDGASLLAFVALLALIFLMLVRYGRVRAPWARRLFLDPVDRARAERAEFEAAAESGADVAPAGGRAAPARPDNEGEAR